MLSQFMVHDFYAGNDLETTERLDSQNKERVGRLLTVFNNISSVRAVNIGSPSHCDKVPKPPNR